MIRRRIPWRLRQHLAWLAVALAAAAVFVLGAFGHAIYFRGQREPATVVDVVYGTLQLFTLNASFEAGPKPWPLDLARLLAPAASFSAVLLALVRLLGQRARLAGTRRHVVVCGLGAKGLHLVSHLVAEGRRVVAIERAADTGALTSARSIGAEVVAGDAASDRVLRQARLGRATDLVAVCGEDATNLAIAMAAERETLARRRAGAPALRAHVHLARLDWCASFRSLGLFAGSQGRFEATTVNVFESAARAAFLDRPLDRDPVAPADDRHVHLIVAGHGPMVEALVLQAARSAHLANLRPPRITVVDPEAARLHARLAASRPQLDSTAEWGFRAGHLDDAQVRRDLVMWARDRRAIVTVAVALDAESESVAAATTLPPEVGECGVPILVEVAADSSLAGLLAGSGSRATLVPFGPLGRASILDERLDVTAKAIHEDYLARAAAEGRQAAADPSLAPWSDLDETFRRSNRHQADHVPVKLRAAGCLLGPRGDGAAEAPLFAFTADEVERLARMEHARWSAERRIGGWRVGPLDKTRRVSPYLIAYEHLDERTRELDRAAVRHLPRILRERAGLDIRRAAAGDSRGSDR